MNTDQLYQVYQENRVICTDTRQITHGCLFFALRGESFDGNLFAEKALDAGAALVVIDNETFKKDDRFIVVDDVLIALQNLARHHRRQLTIPFIGITGSNGKTTTKELLYSVLSQHCRTHATSGNLNNHIGVPLTILSIPENTDIAIIEMGANHQREIEFLCSISQPTHGIITNIGKAHLEGFGGLEGVIKGKGELYEFLQKARATAFVNSDNYLLVDMLRDRKVQKIVRYGKDADNFVSGGLISNSPYLEIEWHREAMEIDDQMHTCKSNLTGTYNFENIMAAICIGIYFKLSVEQVNRGIEEYKPVNNRSQIKVTESNTLICDYYNANPSSMVVALDNLKAAEGQNKVMILGDMFELGKESTAEHQQLIAKAKTIDAGKRIFIGQDFYRFRDASADFYKTTADAYQALKQSPIKNSTVLVKGSRGMKLETLLELL
jgi:UDP-N-acetylmuramoyl-tripeptide--D-alanyl-D-alanine ligase